MTDSTAQPAGSVVAVVCGHLARRRLPAGADGEGLARAGLWLGYVAIAMAVVLVALASAVLVVRTGTA